MTDTAKFTGLVLENSFENYVVEDVKPVLVEVHCPICKYLSLIDIKGCKISNKGDKKGEFDFIGYCNNRECRQTLFVKTSYDYSNLNLKEIYNKNDEDVFKVSRTIEIEGTITQIYPKKYEQIAISDKIPSRYRKDFLEAQQVLNISPNASALLSRRLLQRIIREELVTRDLVQDFCTKYDNVQTPDYLGLGKEIEYFVNDLGVVGSSLRESLQDNIELIKKLGNLGAHPGYIALSDDSQESLNVNTAEAEFIIELLDRFLCLLYVERLKFQEISDRIKSTNVSRPTPPNVSRPTPPNVSRPTPPNVSRPTPPNK